MSLSQRPRGRVFLALSGLVGLCVLGFSLIYLDLPPAYLLAGIAGVATIATLMFRPILGAHVLIALLSFEWLVYGAEGLTAMKAAGVFVVAGWLLSVATNRRLGVRMSLLIVALVLFIGWMGFTMISAIDGEAALVRVLTFVQLGLVAIMFASLVDDVPRLRSVFRTIVISTTLTAIYALVLYYEGTRQVTSGTLLDRNLLASYASIAIVCAYFLFQTSTIFAERVGLLIALPIQFLALALSLSRGGYLTFIVAAVLVWYRVAKTRGYLILLGSLAMIVAITTTLPDAFYRRVGSIIPSIEHQEDTFGTRVLLWKAGLRMIEDHPVVGVGPGNYIVALPRYERGQIHRKLLLAAHNTYIGLAAETGLVGLALFLLMILAAFRESSRPAGAGPPGTHSLSLMAVGVEICIVVLLISGLSTSGETSKLLFMLLGMAASVGQQSLALRTAKTREATTDSGIASPADPAFHPMPGL